MKNASADDHIRKIFENFFDAIFGRGATRLRFRAARAPRVQKHHKRRAPAARRAKKTIFLDENARCARRPFGESHRAVKTCVASVPRVGSGDHTGIVTCDDCRALKHDVNGLQEFFKSVG
ncbi:MAG TPA: hypothetical protein VGP76_12890 [Planctomycetaceae bacterium]|nr:hypothetical protein [Planctomycetaceae bacterium]